MQYIVIHVYKCYILCLLLWKYGGYFGLYGYWGTACVRPQLNSHTCPKRYRGTPVLWYRATAVALCIYWGWRSLVDQQMTRVSSDDNTDISWQYNQPMTIQTFNDNTNIKCYTNIKYYTHIKYYTNLKHYTNIKYYIFKWILYNKITIMHALKCYILCLLLG